MKTELENLLAATLQEYAKRKGLSLPEPFDYELVASKEAGHGDYASNVAFKLAKVAREKPSQIAGEIAGLVQSAKAKDGAACVERVEVAGGGFINFYLNRSSLAGALAEVQAQDRAYGCSNYGKGRRTLIEFVSANPTGPLTIAHGRQAAIGDCLARILEATGHEVKREYYLNNSGRQMRLLGQSLFARYSEVLGKPVPFPEEGYQGDYLKDLGRELAQEKKDALLKMKAEEAAALSTKYAEERIMAGIREDLEAVGVRFDTYFYENSLYDKGSVERTIEHLNQKGFVYEKDGAVWFRTTDFGDDKDRVLRKSTGEYTYLAPDIAYHREKFERKFEWLINLLGPDHHGYITRLKAACQALGHRAEDLEVLIVQLTTLFRQGQPVRMSTRAGEFVTLRELVTEVGADAARFFFVMRKTESPLDFDLDLAKEKSQENPVYYLQYAHARIASLIKFADRPMPKKANAQRLASAEEMEVVKQVADFPQALVRASERLEPYRLVDYLRELAAAFHKFYTFHRVVTDDAELTEARLVLCDAVRIVLRNGLGLLGISQPESM